MSFFWVGHFEFFFSKKKKFFYFIPMKISPNLYGRMDGSKFLCFLWYPENSLVCVILRYTVYLPIHFCWINLLLKLSHTLHYCTSLYYFHMYVKEEKEWNPGSIYFRCMFDARLFKPKQTFNRVSPVLVFLWKKWFAYNNLVLCTYIHMYIVSRCTIVHS